MYFPPTGSPFAQASGASGLVAVVLLVLSLSLAFAGRRVIKALSFAVAGLVLGVIGASAGLFIAGPLGWVAGAVGGFLIGGFLGLLVLSLGIGLGTGYATYLIVLDVSGSGAAALAFGAVLFVVGTVLSGRLLTAVTALLGGLLFYDIVSSVGFTPFAAAAMAALLSISGFLVQSRYSAARPPHYPAPAGGTPQ